MISINIPEGEIYNQETNEIIYIKSQTLTLEHSLVSLSKWESKWKKPFLDPKKDKTVEETLDYVKCMTITQNVDPIVYSLLTQENMNAIQEYINDPMTATWFSENKNQKKNKEIITAELIYYWMIALQIPFECQKWHLNRLLTLIRVCDIKNQPPKKMSKLETMNKNKALNAARRASLGSNG